MRLPLALSLVLHLAVAAGLSLGAPDFGDPLSASNPVQVEVVSEKALAKKLGKTPPKPESAKKKPAENTDKSAPEPPAGEQKQTKTANTPSSAPEPPGGELAADTAPAAPSAEQPAPVPPETPDKPAQPTSDQLADPAPIPETRPASKPQTKPDAQDTSNPEAAPDKAPAPRSKPGVQLADKRQRNTESQQSLDSILKDVEQSYGGGKNREQASSTDKTTASQTAAERADRVSASQRAAIRREIEGCWNVPAGARDAADLVVKLRVRFNSDRSVASVEVLNDERMDDSFFRAAAQSAKRAVHICAPLESLPPDAYSRWRIMHLTFNPKDMLDS